MKRASQTPRPSVPTISPTHPAIHPFIRDLPPSPGRKEGGRCASTSSTSSACPSHYLSSRSTHHLNLPLALLGRQTDRLQGPSQAKSSQVKSSQSKRKSKPRQKTRQRSRFRLAVQTSLPIPIVSPSLIAFFIYAIPNYVPSRPPGGPALPRVEPYVRSATYLPYRTYPSPGMISSHHITSRARSLRLESHAHTPYSNCSSKCDTDFPLALPCRALP